MPVNKDALTRYRVINQCLRNKFHRFPSKQYLADCCREVLGVKSLSVRTIEKDIDDMRYNESLGYLAPIKYSIKHRGYFYENENYSIDKLPLGADDADALVYAASLLSHYKDLEILSGVKETIDKVVESIQVSSRFSDAGFMQNIQFEKAVYQPGGEYLNALIYAVKNKTKVTIEYKRFDLFEEKEYQLEPKLLKEYKGIWYVLAFVEQYNQLRTFALDRVLSIQSLNERQQTDFFEEARTYFNYVIGVSDGGKKPVRIVLEFDAFQANYLKIQPLHVSQEVLEETEQSVKIALNVCPNRELYMTLLGYGGTFKVIAPDEVKMTLWEMVKNMLEKLD